jgi:16S rRNA (guanine527-N7)-methyltransferase
VAAAAPGLEDGLLVDVGSGNGSPGLVLALLRPELPATLLEPRQKRWAFLREAARAGGLSRVDVQRARHQEYAGPAARTLTVRALRLEARDLERLVAPGGRLLVWGVAPAVPADFRPAAAAAGAHAWRRVPRET